MLQAAANMSKVCCISFSEVELRVQSSAKKQFTQGLNSYFDPCPQYASIEETTVYSLKRSLTPALLYSKASISIAANIVLSRVGARRHFRFTPSVRHTHPSHKNSRLGQSASCKICFRSDSLETECRAVAVSGFHEFRSFPLGRGCPTQIVVRII